jgi:hypothetical protein
LRVMRIVERMIQHRCLHSAERIAGAFAPQFGVPICVGEFTAPAKPFCKRGTITASPREAASPDAPYMTRLMRAFPVAYVRGAYRDIVQRAYRGDLG